MRCSQCGDTHTAGILRHHPHCSFYRLNKHEVASVMFEHPSLIDWDANTSYWYPDETRPEVAR